MSLSLNPSNQHQHQHQPVPPSVSCETLEAECNVLGMELLNVLEYIGDSVDYRQITLLIQKLSNSMDFITSSVNKLRNVTTRPGDLEEQLKEKKEELGRLQNKLKQYSEQ